MKKLFAITVSIFITSQAYGQLGFASFIYQNNAVGSAALCEGFIGQGNEITGRIGGNLLLASLQNSTSESSRYFSAGVGGGSGSANMSVSSGGSEKDVKWANEQSSLIGKERLNLKVEGETSLIGSVIGSGYIDEEGKWQNGELSFETGSLSYEDIKNKNYASQKGIGVSLSVTEEGSGTTSVSMTNAARETEGIMRSAIGEGKLIVGGEEVKSDIIDSTDGNITIKDEKEESTGISRDIVNTIKITREEQTRTLNAAFELDNRWISNPTEIINQVMGLPSNLLTAGANAIAGAANMGLFIGGAAQAIYNSATDDKFSFGNAFKETLTSYKVMQTNVDVQRDPKLKAAVEVINNPGAYSPEERQNAETIYAQYAKANGLKVEEIVLTNDEGAPKGSYIKGESALGKNVVSLDVGSVDGKETFYTKEHELSHAGGVSKENSADRIATNATNVWMIENFFHGRSFTITGTQSQYLTRYGNDEILRYNTTRYNSISAEARQDFHKEAGIAAITLTDKIISNLLGKETQGVESENIFGKAGSAAGAIFGVNATAEVEENLLIINAIHASEEYQRFSVAFDNTAYAILSNPMATLSAIGNMPLTILDTLNHNPLEVFLTQEGYEYAQKEYNKQYYLTSGIGLIGTLALDSPIGMPEKQAGKTVIKETAKEAAESGIKQTGRTTAEKITAKELSSNLSLTTIDKPLSLPAPSSSLSGLTQREIEEAAINATHNAASNKLVLGKYEGRGVATSYQEVAEYVFGEGKGATYFEMSQKEWSSMSSVDRLRVNNEFLRQQIEAGKDIYMSHNPLTPTSSFREEVKFLKEKYGIFEYERVGDLWKAIK